MRREEEAILLCVLADRDAAQEDRLRSLIGVGGQVEAGSFWSEAAQQQVSPLVARTLSAASVSPHLPASILEEARSVRLQTMFRNMALHTELLKVADALQSEGVPTVPLKGTHLCEYVYGALDARQVGDIDILVPQPQIERAHRVLRRMGYAPAVSVPPGAKEHTFHGVPLVRQGPTVRFVIEPHWELSDSRFVSIDYDNIWKRVLAGENDPASPLLSLPDEEWLLFLSLHLPKHDTGVLRLLADIDRLVRRGTDTLDWACFIALAQEWSATSLAYFALQRSWQLLGTPVPSWVLDRLEPSSFRRAFVGLLAGPFAILRPPASEHLRSNRFRLAYCAMLQPSGRAVRAYWHYLFSRPGMSPGPGSTPAVLAVVRQLARGAAWTGLALASAFSDRRCRPVVRAERTQTA